MIRTALKGLALLGALATTAAYADVKAPANKYSSAPYTKTFNAALVPPTNIAILNFSSDTVYAVVPGFSIPLLSGNANTITHPTYWDDSYLTLQDPYHTPFYNRYVCHRAIVTIGGTPGYYRIDVDSRYC